MDNKSNQDWDSKHLPQIEITVSEECIVRQNKPKELILVEEGQFYALAFFNLLMMITDKEIHIETDTNFAIRTIAFLGKRFTDIAVENLDLLEDKINA